MVSTLLMTGEKQAESSTRSGTSSPSLVIVLVLTEDFSGVVSCLKLRFRGVVSEGGSVMGGDTGLVEADVGGAPNEADGGAEILGFPKGSIPAASCAIWLRGSATGDGWGEALLGGGNISLSACLTTQGVLGLLLAMLKV